MHQVLESQQQPILLSQQKFDNDLWLVKFWFPYKLFWDIMTNDKYNECWLMEFCYQFNQHEDVADWDYDAQTIEFWFRVN